MIGTPGFGYLFNAHLLCRQRIAAAIVLLFALGLHCFDVRAALLFRSVTVVDGERRWSPARNYANPSDTAYAQFSATAAEARAEEVRVILSGNISHADVDSAAVLERMVKSGRQKIAGNTVWLASGGGDIDAAMELGRLLRRLGIFTVVDKNDRCLSACVFAFMGGERRSVAGQLGIHRPYFPYTTDVPDRAARFRHLEKALKAFIEEMDFPDSFYEAVMLVPPESLQILSVAELKRFYLEGISPSSEDMVDAAAARRLNLSMFEFLKRKAQAPACDFFAAGEGRCDGKVREAAASDMAADDAVNMQTRDATPAGTADTTKATGQLIRLSNPPKIDLRDPT